MKKAGTSRLFSVAGCLEALRYSQGLKPVNKQVETEPDNVHKVPVPCCAFKAEVMVGSEVPFDQAEQDHGKHCGTDDHAETVEARQHVEQRTVRARIKTQVKIGVGVEAIVCLASHEDE